MASDLRYGRDELLKVNADLENRRKYIQTVLTNIAAGVIAIDADQKVTAFNAPCLKLLGINSELKLGWPLLDQLDEDVAGRLHETIGELERIRFRSHRKAAQDFIFRQDYDSTVFCQHS